eukprot:scaffold15696_cov113-Isochrysis_galbana.AAC.9
MLKARRLAWRWNAPHALAGLLCISAPFPATPAADADPRRSSAEVFEFIAPVHHPLVPLASPGLFCGLAGSLAHVQHQAPVSLAGDTNLPVVTS